MTWLTPSIVATMSGTLIVAIGMLAIYFKKTKDALDKTRQQLRDLYAEQEETQDKLRLQGEIISRMSEGVYLVRRDGMIVYANPRFETMFGYDPGELIGQYATMLQATPGETMGFILNYFETHTTWQGENQNLKKDGTKFWTYASVTVFNHRQHGEVYIAVHLDITDQKKAGKEKQDMEIQLRHAHKMRAVGTLSGGIAHEFNNILAIILGNVELALDDISANHLLRGSLEEVQTACLRGKTIVQQLLSFSHKDATAVDHRKINITAFLDGPVRFIKKSLPKQIELHQAIDPDCDRIMANPEQLRQVLVNLCSNAIHSMEPAGGVLSFRAENIRLETPLFSGDRSIGPGRYVCLTVSDTGHGIREEDLDRVFDPFYTTKPVDKGSGMGLAVVHGIMKAHDGAILLHSTVDQGTVCQCYFPAAAPD